MKEKGQVFGQSCLGLLAKYDQNTRSLKTFQLSLFEAEPESLETLPKSGMTVSGKLWEQTMWAHPTGENEYGLLHTPTTTANQLAPSMKDRDAGSWGKREMWPTPSAQQAGEGPFLEKLETKEGHPPEPNQRAYNPETGKHVQVTLNRAVKMWPTPSATPRGPHTGAISGSVAEDGKSRVSAKGIKFGATLETAVKMWPTPRASEWKDTGPVGSKSHTHMDKRDYLCAKVKDPEQPKGALDPQFVEWLMGYPKDYTKT